MDVVPVVAWFVVREVIVVRCGVEGWGGGGGLAAAGLGALIVARSLSLLLMVDTFRINCLGERW